VRVGFFQFAPKFGDPSANLARVEAALSKAAADLVVLPELFSTGYCFADRAELAGFAESFGSAARAASPTLTGLQNLVDRAGIAIAAGVAERATDDRLFNSAVLLVPGQPEPWLTYRKIHLFGREKELFDPGDRAPQTAVHQGCRIGLEVCFDHFFPELTRTLALQGAQLICHPANLVLRYARQTTVARALENGIFWVMANRVGTEEHSGRQLAFTGHSQIVGPRGRILVAAGETEEVLRVTEFDPSRADDKEIFKGNDLLKDRRPDLY
jgi:predicted amidohydrolase